MHLVTADLGQGLDQGHHCNVGLNRMVAGDKPYIAAAHNQDFFRGFYQITVDQGLKCPGTVYTRQGIARKGEHLLPGTRGHQQFFGPDFLVLIVLDHPDNVI